MKTETVYDPKVTIELNNVPCIRTQIFLFIYSIKPLDLGMYNNISPSFTLSLTSHTSIVADVLASCVEYKPVSFEVIYLQWRSDFKWSVVLIFKWLRHLL